MREAVVRGVEEVCGAKIDLKDVTVSRNTVFIKGPNALKSELFIHQEKLSAFLEKTLAGMPKKQVR